VVVLVLALSWCGPARAETEEEVVVKVLQAYEDAWSRHDAQAVASIYYEPAMRVTRGGPVVRPTRTEQEAFFSGFLRGLVSRGYARSAWEQLEVRLLDAETAIASGVTGRYRADGSLLERVAVTYGLRKTAAGWKIFLSATHAPDTVLRFR
jgi:uncharacterized protein (TIGR02246 family)